MSGPAESFPNRTLVFEAFAHVARRELDDEMADLPVTAEHVAEVVELTFEDSGFEKRGRWTGQVKTWLSDQHKHSPHVDLVAIRRAAKWDQDVIDALTPEERRVFIGLLATRSDPWGELREHPEFAQAVARRRRAEAA